MFHHRRTSRCAFAVGLLLSVGLTLSHAELSSTSPFLPPQGQAVAAPTIPPPLELRGINVLDNVTTFSIFDATAKKPAGWLKLNEPGPGGFTIKSFDAQNDTVTVDYQGRTLKLVMRTPKIGSLGPVAPASPLPVQTALQTPGAPIGAARAPVAVSPVPTPSVPPPTEAAKMKEWTDEIERRRTVRNQVPGTPATPGTTPVTVPIPGPQPQTSNLQGGPGPQPLARPVEGGGPVPSSSPLRPGQ